MSQRQAPSRANGPPTNAAKRAYTPEIPRTLPSIHNDRPSTVPQVAPMHPLEQPSGSAARPVGPVGMQKLLNPSSQDESTNTRRHPSIGSSDPPPATGILPPQLPTPQLSQSPTNNLLPSLTPPTSAIYPANIGQPPRRILTPRTPSIYNTQPATMGLPSGTIDATKSPFIGSRGPPNVIQNSGAPPPAVSHGTMLPDAVAGLLPFNHSPPEHRPNAGAVQLQGFHERRASLGGLSSQPPASQSNSPSTSYSSYSRFSRTPPAPHAVVTTSRPSSFFAPHNDGKSSVGSAVPPSFGPKESFGRVAGSMGHNALQLMTLDTEQGPIQVPVDVTAASKVADEKRKRNATASHRFRQRRKEKERETSQNIAKLEHQIRDLAEERDYYRLERDFFRSMASKETGLARLPPRPPSPRQIRLAHLNGENTVLREGQWQAHDEDNRHGRNTRRRTSGYTPATDIVPPVNAAPAHLPRYGSMTSDPSDNTDAKLVPGNRSTLPASAGGPFDSVAHPHISRGWKPA